MNVLPQILSERRNTSQGVATSFWMCRPYKTWQRISRRADEIVYHGKSNAGVIGDLNLVAGISYDRPLDCSTSHLVGFECQRTIPGTK